MKTLQFCSLAFTAFTLNVAAVTTVTISNLNTVDTNDSAIVDNTGTPIAVGFGSISVGYFSSFTTASDFSLATKSSLLGDFVAFSSTSESFANGFNAEGFFDVEYNETINSGDEIIGQTLFTIIGDGNTLNDSDDFLVFRHDGVLFEEEVAGVGGASGLVRLGSGTLLVGADGGPTTVLGTNVGSFQMATLPIPEPSSSALLALAGVGFILRRRR